MPLAPIKQVNLARMKNRELTVTVAGNTSDTFEVLYDASVVYLTATGGTDNAFSLGDGEEGQWLFLYLSTKGGAGDAVVTPTTLTGGTTITFNAVDQVSLLRFVNASWKQVAGDATVA